MPTNFKHTPGPWRISENPDAIVAENGTVIVGLEHVAGKNAPSIAAVPEMLSLLQLAKRYLEHPDVKALPFALPSETVAARIDALLEGL